MPPGRASGRTKIRSKTPHAARTKTVQHWRLHYLWLKTKVEEVRLYPIYDGGQPDVLRQGRAIMACQRSQLQEVIAATWNVSSMVGRSGDVVNALHRRLTSVVIKRRGGSARMFGAIGIRYKLFWQGCKKETASVGVFIAARWIDIVVYVVGVN